MIPISGEITPVIENLVKTNKAPQTQSVDIKNIKLAIARLKNLPVVGI